MKTHLYWVIYRFGEIYMVDCKGLDAQLSTQMLYSHHLDQQCIRAKYINVIHMYRHVNYLIKHILKMLYSTEIYMSQITKCVLHSNPDSKAHEANMGPTWVLSAPDGPNVGRIYVGVQGMAEYYYQSICMPLAWELPRKEWQNGFHTENYCIWPYESNTFFHWI